MFDIVIRRGDTLPKIQKTFYVNGAVVDLTGYTIKFMVDKIDGTNVINNNASILGSPTLGTVIYQWTDADTAQFTDDYGLARFEATAGSDSFTVPNNSPLSLLLTSTTLSEYSYTGNPAARDIDKVRFLLGDTDMSKSLFTDSEISFLMGEFANPYAAAAEAALSYAARYTDLRDKTVGPLSIRYSSSADAWNKLARSLRLRASRRSGATAIMTQSSECHIFAIGQNDFPVGLGIDPWNDPQHLSEPPC